MATLFLITCIASCSEEDISVTRKYGNLTGADDTVITIEHGGDGYTMKCTYKISEAVKASNGTELSIILPTDAVVGSNVIENLFQRNPCEKCFTAYTQKKDSYKAYRDERQTCRAAVSSRQTASGS